ncbi:MAG: hypothetical protein PVI91_12560 [Gammaproteobacteria bacterium]|jgi:hypothetical protein
MSDGYANLSEAPKLTIRRVDTVSYNHPAQGRAGQPSFEGNNMDELLYPGANERMREARTEYRLGRSFFDKGRWKSAASHFGQAERISGREDVYRQLYRSCHGLSLIYAGDVSGLNLCRNAAGLETVHAAVFLNLALAELRLHHRKRACQAVSRGLKVDPRHKELLALRRKMGVRRPPFIPFLKRDNLLNKWLGKATYRSARRGSTPR